MDRAVCAALDLKESKRLRQLAMSRRPSRRLVFCAQNSLIIAELGSRRATGEIRREKSRKFLIIFAVDFKNFLMYVIKWNGSISLPGAGQNNAILFDQEPCRSNLPLAINGKRQNRSTAVDDR